MLDPNIVYTVEQFAAMLTTHLRDDGKANATQDEIFQTLDRHVTVKGYCKADGTDLCEDRQEYYDIFRLVGENLYDARHEDRFQEVYRAHVNEHWQRRQQHFSEARMVQRSYYA